MGWPYATYGDPEIENCHRANSGTNPNCRHWKPNNGRRRCRNPILRRLKESTLPRGDLEFKELSVGGIKLVEEILDYKTVFIIDSIESSTTVGKINEFSPDQFNITYHESAPHALNFFTALELYRKLEPSRIPEEIRIFTIDIKSEFAFTESLTPTIQTAAAQLAELLANEIGRIHNRKF